MELKKDTLLKLACDCFSYKGKLYGRKDDLVYLLNTYTNVHIVQHTKTGERFPVHASKTQTNNEEATQTQLAGALPIGADEPAEVRRMGATTPARLRTRNRQDKASGNQQTALFE